MSKSVGPDSSGRPSGRWKDRLKEYMCERGATRRGWLDQARRECLGGISEGFPALAIPLGSVPGGSKESELKIDR